VLDRILHQIALIRRSKEYTQARMAKELGLERSTYARKEKGKIPLTLKEFLLISEILEIRPESFFKPLSKK